MSQALAQTSASGAGFADAAMDSQAVFRTVMNALAEPGIVRPLDASVLASLDAPAPLLPASTAILLALADYETPVWLDAALDRPEITAYLRFHTGCALVQEKARASFAVVADGTGLSDFGGFAIGTLEYPDRSTTLIVQVANLSEGTAWHLSGPGIAASRTVHLSPVHAALPTALAANRALFPCGVDLVFTDGAAVLGLPRSTVVAED
jgi:alpha-D-ribose 1-methylphosphonate 5-triphosphate synthase subunit PhnH